MTIAINPLQTLKRVVGNLEPIGAELTDIDGEAINLSGLSVTFRMVSLDDGTVVVNDVAATVQSASAGLVSYTPVAADVDTAGSYAMYFIDNTDGSPRRWPYDGPTFVLELVAEEGT